MLSRASSRACPRRASSTVSQPAARALEPCRAHMTLCTCRSVSSPHHRQRHLPPSLRTRRNSSESQREASAHFLRSRRLSDAAHTASLWQALARMQRCVLCISTLDVKSVLHGVLHYPAKHAFCIRIGRWHWHWRCALMWTTMRVCTFSSCCLS